MNVIKGKVFYKMIVENNETLLQELTAFLQAKKVSTAETEKVQNMKTGDLVSVRGADFKLDLELQEREVILLFATEMNSEEFAVLTYGHFS